MNAGIHGQQWQAYWRLMRLDKPIGIYLLLWPTWWALWLAAEGIPPLDLFIVFTLGVIIMRSAGCVINDYADRHFDGQVERTRNRPLASGQLSAKQALGLFGVLLLLASSLLLFLNHATRQLALIAVLLASCYPFMKRFTHWPQLVLGAAYSWGIPMAFMALQQEVPVYAWWLYAANLCWTLAYDTFYAMVDRPDDLKAGIKSTAVLLGSWVQPTIAVWQLLFLGGLAAIAQHVSLPWLFYLTLVAALIMFAWQHWLARQSREGAFKAFLANHYVGLILFAGLALSMGL